MWRWTLLLNALAAAATLWLMSLEIRNAPRALDERTLILGGLLLVAPYLWLSGLSFLLRVYRRPSIVLFAASCLLGLFGIWILATNTAFEPVRPPVVAGDNLAPVIVVLFQWPATALLTLFSGACAMVEQRSLRGRMTQSVASTGTH